MCHGCGGGREGVLGDGFAQDGEGRGEDFVLMVEGWVQCDWDRGVQGWTFSGRKIGPLRVIAEFVRRAKLTSPLPEFLE
jgi:hypothetical protein